MPSKASIRFSLIGAVLAVLLVLSAATAVRFLFPVARAAALFQHQVSERFGREIRFGHARFTGLSTLRLEKVEVTGLPVSATAVLVRAEIIPLLFGRVSVDSLRVESGSFRYVDPSSATLTGAITGATLVFRETGGALPISFEGRGDGVWRGVSASLTAAGALDPAKGTLSISSLAINAGPHARVRVDGETKVGTNRRHGVRLHARWSGVDPSSFTAVAALPEGLGIRGETSGEFRLETSSSGYRARLTCDLTPGAVDWKDVVAKASGTKLLVDTTLIKDWGTLYLRDLAVTLASIDLQGDGEIRASGVTGQTASLRLRTTEFDIEDFFRHLKVTAPDGVTLRGPVSAIVSVDGWTGGGSFVADVDGSALDAAYKSTFHKSPGAPLRMLADGRYTTPVAVDISSLRLDFSGIRMSGRGSYTPGKDRPTYTFRVKTNAFSLASAAELTPMIRRYQSAGLGVIAMRVTRGDEGPAMSGDLTLIGASAAIGGSSLTNLSGTMKFTDDALSARSITGRLDGSPLHVDLRAQRFGDRPFFEADINVDEINLEKFLSTGPARSGAAAEPYDTSGVLRAGHIEHPQFSADDLTIEWNLSSVGGDPAALNGLVSWRQGPGRLGEARDIAVVSTAARAALLPMTLLQRVGDVTAFTNVAFESIDDDVSFTAGKRKFSFMLLGDDRKAELRGTAGMDSQEPLVGAATLHTPGRKSSPLRVTISGTPADPTLVAENP